MATLIVAIPFAGAAGQAGSTYQPGIDVLDYDVHLELPDTGAFIRGDVTVTLRRARGTAALRLDLVRALTVRDVAVDGRNVPVERDGDALVVSLAPSRGDSLRVRVGYDGVVTDGLIVRRDARGRWTWFGDNWPDRARQWLPTVDHPSDKATVGWTVRAPSGRTVVANGSFLAATPLAGVPARTETRWREAHPIATYLMVIGAGPLVRVPLDECVAPARAGCVRQAAYAKPEDVPALGPFAAAVPIVALYERLVGPFPYERLDHLQSETRFGGMENASAIFYSSELFAKRRMTERLIAHETAHQWFGDAVTEREWGHLWLSEGFATYFAALWARERGGDSAYRATMRRIRTEVLADPVVAARPVLDTAERDYMKLLNTNSYKKGGYVLYMLHERLGERAFFAGLRDYYASHRDGTALTADLVTALERASGMALGPFFDQWLRRTGLPEVTLGWAWDPTTQRVAVQVLQETALPYELSLEVTMQDAADTVRHALLRVPAERRASAELPWPLTGRPVRLTLDPDEKLLARLRAP